MGAILFVDSIYKGFKCRYKLADSIRMIEPAEKYTENRCRVLRLVENITLGTAAVGYRTESMHGAGSPQAQRIMISRQGNLEQKKKLAKDIAGIKD